MSESEVDRTGFERLPVVLKGVDADFPGANTRTTYAPGEKEAFDRVRAEFDRVLQVTNVAVTQPQTFHQTPKQYEAALLAAICPHTAEWRAFDHEHGPLLSKYKAKIVEDAMGEPARQGRLAEVKIVDERGLPRSEFIGPMKSWTKAYEAAPAISSIFVNGQAQRW